MAPGAPRCMLGLMLLAFVGFVVASIETDPVRVTHRNSGPRYDLSSENEVDRVRLPIQPEAERPVIPEEEQPTGHLTIRRIFLFPIHQAPRDVEQSGPSEPETRPISPFGSLFNRGYGEPSPFSGLVPFAAHPREPMHHSQPSPPLMAGGEREEPQEATGLQEAVDPFQLMLHILRQTLNAAVAADAKRASEGTKEVAKEPADLDKDASLEPPRDLFGDSAKKMNESKEEVVEIAGKKYSRKMVVTKHVGDNMFFITRRLIFTPLNETDSTSETEPKTETENKTEIENKTETENKAETQPKTETGPKPETEPKAEPAPATTTSFSTTVESTSEPKNTEEPKVKEVESSTTAEASNGNITTANSATTEASTTTAATEATTTGKPATVAEVETSAVPTEELTTIASTGRARLLSKEELVERIEESLRPALGRT